MISVISPDLRWMPSSPRAVRAARAWPRQSPRSPSQTPPSPSPTPSSKGSCARAPRITLAERRARRGDRRRRPRRSMPSWAARALSVERDGVAPKSSRSISGFGPTLSRGQALFHVESGWGQWCRASPRGSASISTRYIPVQRKRHAACSGGSGYRNGTGRSLLTLPCRACRFFGVR